MAGFIGPALRAQAIFLARPNEHALRRSAPALSYFFAAGGGSRRKMVSPSFIKSSRSRAIVSR